MGGASRRRNVGFWRGNKYVLLAVGLLGSAVLSVPLIGYLYPPAVLARELHGWAYALSLGSEGTWQRALTAAGAALLGLVAVEVFISRRMWCRYLCPGGALYSLLGARRLIKVTPPDERCDQCGLCVTECGMGLNPMAGITGVECDNCLACLSHCPPDALHLGTGTRTDGVT
jgi:ferredoxin-type protein NapH